MNLSDFAGDPLAALRHATGDQHDILDSGLPLAQPDAALPAYIAHLQMLARWMGPIDAWLAGFDDGPQGPAAPPPAPRMALIAADLALAGAAMPAGAEAAWPPHASAAWRWGVAYVVEGSQLGGAVLYKRLAEPLAPHPLSYLKPDADGPGPRWRAFSAALRAALRSDADIAEACAGARAAFAAILALRPAEKTEPACEDRHDG
jgi:heme oxygenase